MTSTTKYSQFNIFLINCTKLDDGSAVLTFATQFPDAYEHPQYRYRVAAIERQPDLSWRYTSVIAAGSNNWLPECATRCNAPIANILGADVTEAVKIAIELEVL